MLVFNFLVNDFRKITKILLPDVYVSLSQTCININMLLSDKEKTGRTKYNHLKEFKAD